MKKILVVLALFTLTACSSAPPEPGQYAEVAQCLTEKGVQMYGTSWCPHCQDQKDMFGNDWQFIDYIECDQGSPQRPLCAEAQVFSYPSWIFPGQERLEGTQPIEILAQKAACTEFLPESLGNSAE